MINLKDLKELTQNLKVLYVEDDVVIQKTMMKYLKKFFLRVVSANDGLEGLESYRKKSLI